MSPPISVSLLHSVTLDANLLMTSLDANLLWTSLDLNVFLRDHSSEKSREHRELQIIFSMELN